jgi:hypothetical protein
MALQKQTLLQTRQPGLAGLLRETVTFQQHALDVNGDRLGPWTDMFDLPARVVAQTRGEQVLQQRIAGVQPVQVTLRLDLLSAQIDTDWRMVWLNWPFEITAVAVDELGASVALLAVRARDVVSAS